MPQILVLADAPEGAGEVVYRERVAASNMESKHFSGQLMERVSWAVGDADVLEHQEPQHGSAAKERRAVAR
jgi:hypothetical protein